MKSFISVISSTSTLSEQSIELILQHTHTFYYNKKDVILQKNEICDYLYFTKEGLTRVFCYENDKDLTESFAPENTFFSAWESLVTHQPSNSIIEALEPSIILGISHDDLIGLCQGNFEINMFYHRIKNSTIASVLKWVRLLNTRNAAERYQEFIKENPIIIKKAPLIHIASYLGITPETLSRIRYNQFNYEPSNHQNTNGKR